MTIMDIKRQGTEKNITERGAIESLYILGADSCQIKSLIRLVHFVTF